MTWCWKRKAGASRFSAAALTDERRRVLLHSDALQPVGEYGDALVESTVRPNLTAADEDKFGAGDIDTGEYELDNRETDDR